MSKTGMLRDMANKRMLTDSVDRKIQSGSLANLYEDNPFMAHFDTVHYSEGYFKDYETLADEKVQQRDIRHMKEVAAKSNPHMKAAMTDFQDYVVGGWGFKPHRSIVVDKLLDTMEDEHGGFDSYLSDVTDSLFLHSAFFHGSIYNEMKELRRFICYEHNTAEFIRIDTDQGQDYGLVQRTGPNIRDVVHLYKEPNYFYRRLYSKANYPYGVPFVDASIWHMVMMVEFFKSYRTLLDTFILPNLFFRVDREVIKEHVVLDPTKRGPFVKKVFSQLVNQVKNLGKKGRVIAMGSEVEAPEILSGMNDETMGGAETLINALDNQLELALKTHGLTTLRNDSALNDTKAKYRMANYSRVVKRAQKVIVNSINRQLALGHMEANSSEMSELYLERNIYEDEQILAEIRDVVGRARKSGHESLEKLLVVLAEAQRQGRLSKRKADQLFLDEIEKMNSIEISEEILS